MTPSSSVQRYNNSCVIPKSYEQKKLQLLLELQLYIRERTVKEINDTSDIIVCE